MQHMAIASVGCLNNNTGSTYNSFNFANASFVLVGQKITRIITMTIFVVLSIWHIHYGFSCG